MPQHQEAIGSRLLTFAAPPPMLMLTMLFTLVVQVSRPLEWTGHLQKAVQYMASCARLPSPPAPTSPSSQNSVNLPPPPPPPPANADNHETSRLVSLLVRSRSFRSKKRKELPSV